MTIPPRPPYPPDPPPRGPDPDDGGEERDASDADGSPRTGPSSGSLTSKIFGPAGASGTSGGAGSASGGSAGAGTAAGASGGSAGASGGPGGSSGASGGSSASGGDGSPSGTPKGAAWAIIAVVAALALAIGTFLGMTVFGGSTDSREPVATGPTQTSAPGHNDSGANGAGAADTPTPESTGPESPSASPTHSGMTVPTFQSPSNNIACSIDDGTVRCDIMKKKYETPDPPDGCEGKFGHTFFANSDESRLECAEDSVRVDGAQVLDYGESTSTEGVTCVSEKTGMTCTVDATGHGFTIARANYTLF